MNKVEEFKDYLLTLSNDERYEIFGELFDTFCKYCGTHQENYSCHCWNDE